MEYSTSTVCKLKNTEEEWTSVTVSMREGAARARKNQLRNYCYSLMKNWQCKITAQRNHIKNLRNIR